MVDKRNGTTEIIPVITTLSLGDVVARPLTVAVKLPDEREVSINVMPLSYIRWNEIGWLVPEPDNVMKTEVIGGKKQKVVNEKATRRAKHEAAQKRTLLRLAEALIGAGNFPELADKSLDEQVEALRTVDSGWLNTVGVWLQGRASADNRRIALLKNTFQASADAEAGDDVAGQEGMDADAVDESE